MNPRFIAMLAGTLFCLTPLLLAPGAIARLPYLLDVDFSSLNAIVAWALIVTTTLVPVVCLVSLVCGWLAWAEGKREAALPRMLLWPSLAVALSGALFLIGQLLQR